MALWKRHDRHPDPDEVRMTLGEHLEELRARVVRALAAVMVGAILCYVYIGDVMYLLLWPMYDVLEKHGLPRQMFVLSMQEAFVTELKIACIAGFILTAPYGLTQIWGFVAAGLYKHERRWVRRFVPVSIALFFVGAFFMLFVVAPPMLDFFAGYRETYPTPRLVTWLQHHGADSGQVPHSQPVWPTTQSVPAFQEDPPRPPEGVPWANLGARETRIRFGDKTYSMGPLTEARDGNRIVPLPRLNEYIVLVLQMMAAFGIGFQMPVVVALLATLGIATAKDMSGYRKHVYFAISIASAIITPSADWLSMTALMVPMVVLFEVGLVTARLIERERAKSAG